MRRKTSWKWQWPLARDLKDRQYLNMEKWETVIAEVAQQSSKTGAVRKQDQGTDQ